VVWNAVGGEDHLWAIIAMDVAKGGFATMMVEEKKRREGEEENDSGRRQD
jgi:phage replication-related protein YjqB (UPF0714/DUF867 family)